MTVASLFRMIIAVEVRRFPSEPAPLTQFLSQARRHTHPHLAGHRLTLSLWPNISYYYPCI